MASWHEDRKLTRAASAQPGWGGGTLSQRSMELQAAACRVGDGEGVRMALMRYFSCTRRSVPLFILSPRPWFKMVVLLRSYRGRRRRAGIQDIVNPTVNKIGNRGESRGGHDGDQKE